MAGISGNRIAINYKYSDAGIRTKKVVKDAATGKSVTTNYLPNSDKVIFEDNGTDKIYYSYDSAGDLVSFNLNSVEYYYIRNAQGDIIGLFDNTGVQVVSYIYDSWGKLISIKDQNGTDVTSNKDHVGYKNPYRYRDYRYDSEIGLYYLQSRYYNPGWGRFVNADAIVGEFGELLGHNIFAYCKNNFASMHDDDGYRPDYGDGTGRETEEQRKASLAHMAEVSQEDYNNSQSSVLNSVLNEEQKMFVSVVYAEAVGESARSQEAVALTIKNRIGKGYWESTKSITDVITQPYQYSSYMNEMYKDAMAYLNQRDGSNEAVEGVIIAIMPVYNGNRIDFTGGAQSYYSPKNMQPVNSAPEWAIPGKGFDEVPVSGISTDSFRFYKLN